MFKDGGIRRVLVLQSALMAAIVTLVAMLAYALAQQVIRQDANYPQVQMAQEAASRLATGTSLPISESDRVDPSRSLAPFVIVFDGSGHPISSSAVLGDNIPVPPEGVFRYTQTHREDRVTWQPRPEVRIAAVIMAYGGAHPGFVLASRSMAEVQASGETILHLAILGWLGIVSILGIGSVGLLWLAQAPEPQPSVG